MDGKSRYTAYYKDARGKERSAGTFGNRKAADRAWQKKEVDLASGKIGDPRRGRQTFYRYVTEEWFPNHQLAATTRQTYTYLLDRYILPELGPMRMVDILPCHVREWTIKLQQEGANPPTIQRCKVIVDAIFTTALNDQITFLHAGKGVKTPPVAAKTRRIITPDQFDSIYCELPDNDMRLLVETDIESGLRWGELTELRPRDFAFPTRMLTVSRAVVELNPKFHPDGGRFLVKDYPKDEEWRQFRVADHLVDKLTDHIKTLGLGPEDLLFGFRQGDGPRRRIPDVLPDPATLGRTEPNEKGRTYPHGTPTAYAAGRCRCRYCKDAVAAYRAQRRSEGRDQPRTPRTVDTDGHVGRDWFRRNVWLKALAGAGLGFHVTPHGLRHAHASWLLAGGADLQVVKERLGHGSITTTQKYLHTLPGTEDAAVNALARIRGGGGGHRR
ncbi:MAG: site-specific integrase [Dactylosporangium sp.]|nr:site-specific integrase [Dactylosporangium sp.]